ncbi:MAG: glycosyltransferase family 87 protein [Planctomycetota bacterium]
MAARTGSGAGTGRRWTGPRRFTAVCGALAAAWLGVAVLPYVLTRPLNQDFPQFYMAGALAAEGRWPSLYPDPVPGAGVNAGFYVLRAEGDLIGSTPKPGYSEAAERRGVQKSNRFIYPPPVALLAWPFGELRYRPAKCLFGGLLAAASWGTGFWAVAIGRRLRGGPSRVDGLVWLLICVSPMTLASLRLMNVTPLIAFGIGAAVWAMLSHGRARAAGPVAVAALSFGGVFKSTTAPLWLLEVALGRWRVAGGVVAVAAVTMGLGVAVGGVGPLREYVEVILPTLGHGVDSMRNNQSLSVVAGWAGLAPEAATAWTQRLGLAVIALAAAAVFAQRHAIADDPGRLAAWACLMLTVYLITSPLCWEHYALLTAPFWGGWLSVGRGSRWRGAVLGLAVLSAWSAFAGSAGQPLHPYTPDWLVKHHLWTSLAVVGVMAGIGLRPGPRVSEAGAEARPTADYSHSAPTADAA